MRMMDCRSGKVMKSNRINPVIKEFLLKKSDLDTVFTNNEGFLFKLEDIFGSNDKLSVLFIVNINDLKNVDTKNYDVVITRTGETSLNQYTDVTEFFIKSSYYNLEKAVIFTLTKP